MRTIKARIIGSAAEVRPREDAEGQARRAEAVIWTLASTDLTAGEPTATALVHA